MSNQTHQNKTTLTANKSNTTLLQINKRATIINNYRKNNRNNILKHKQNKQAEQTQTQTARNHQPNPKHTKQQS